MPGIRRKVLHDHKKEANWDRVWLRRDKRNRRRRAAYKPTGRKRGRPAKYSVGVLVRSKCGKAHHRRQDDPRGGRLWIY